MLNGIRHPSAHLVLLLLTVLLAAGCTQGARPMPSPSATGVVPATVPRSVSASPTALAYNMRNKILLQFTPSEPSRKATLEISDPDGGNRQLLADVAPGSGSVAVSPDGQYIAFFTSGPESAGSLTVRDAHSGETVVQVPVAAEISNSFRDAPAMRYLAWSPGAPLLASAMNRDLYLLEIGQPDARLLVRHRDARYNLAGEVMGSVGHPTWSADGGKIVYDEFVPPFLLSASADLYRGVESIEVSTLVTQTLLEEAHIVQRMSSSTEPELLLKKNEEQGTFALSLTPLEVRPLEAQPETPALTLCNAGGDGCVSIASEQGERDVLQLQQAEQGGGGRQVRLADLGETAPGCAFQSVLWDPDGRALLATEGCSGRVALWSIALAEQKPTRLADWPNVGAVELLFWFR